MPFAHGIELFCYLYDLKWTIANSFKEGVRSSYSKRQSCSCYFRGVPGGTASSLPVATFDPDFFAKLRFKMNDSSFFGNSAPIYVHSSLNPARSSQNFKNVQNLSRNCKNNMKNRIVRPRNNPKYDVEHR
jgi:hypothetical protein